MDYSPDKAGGQTTRPRGLGGRSLEHSWHQSPRFASRGQRVLRAGPRPTACGGEATLRNLARRQRHAVRLAAGGAMRSPTGKPHPENSPAVSVSRVRSKARHGTWQAATKVIGAAVDEKEGAAANDIATLPMRLGGLGIRSAARTAPVAYWASWGRCAANA